MELNTKKIIAKEGLVIISVMTFSGIFLLLNIWFSEKQREIHDYGRIFNVTDPQGISHDIPGTQKNIQKRLNEIVDKTTGNNRKQWIKIKYGKQIDTIQLREKYVKYANYAEIAFFFSIFTLYPMYLLFRFIFWAISILRK